jgi:RHS repeat-associated protein
MLMPGRKFSSTGEYRYGFNGKENDNEIKGEGNQQDYGMRIFDPRLGRFLSVDPLYQDYPELSVYQFASNRPIDGIDLDGAEFRKADLMDILNKAKAALGKLIAENSIVADGMADAILNANSWGITDKLGRRFGTDDLDDYGTSYDKSLYLWGRVVGDVVAGLTGLAEVTGGSTTAAGGLSVSTTGVGAFAGLPAAVAGGIVAGHGAETGAAAALDLGLRLSQLQQLGAFGTTVSDGSQSKPKTPENTTNNQSTTVHNGNDQSAQSNTVSPSPKKTVKQQYKELTDQTRKEMGGNVTVQKKGKDLFRIHKTTSGHGFKVTKFEASPRTNGKPSAKDVPVNGNHIKKLKKAINKEGGYGLRKRNGQTN